MAQRPPAEQATKVPEIRKGDTVVVLTGKDAGKRGVVDRVIRDPQGMGQDEDPRRRILAHVSPLSEVAVVVEGVNIAKRHTKPRPTELEHRPDAQGPAGRDPRDRPADGRSARSWSCAASASEPTRIKHAVLDNGQRVRVCSHCGERLEVKA